MADRAKPAAGAEPRRYAAQALREVLDHGSSLTEALAGLERMPASRDRALARRLCNRVLRDLPALEWRLDQLLDRPLKRPARVVHYLLLIGIDQLVERREPAAAVVHACVAAAERAGQRHLAGLVNAVLRNHQRRASALEAALPDNDAIRLGYPDWLLDAIRRDWPEHWRAIAAAGNAVPPMWLRVNRRRTTPEKLADMLAAAGIEATHEASFPDSLQLALHARVSALPGYDDGLFSVQDAGAQAAADLLALEPGLSVLDACAAPGGKAAHILERADVDLTAVDSDPVRARRIGQNLERLGLNGRVVVGDAARAETFAGGGRYGRILVDAPCSATGVMRRHPDVRWLRRAADIDANAALQRRILRAVWPHLAPGGLLVYASCSILRAENCEQILDFTAEQKNAEACTFELDDAAELAPGRQILPGSLDRDGFYYACLRRVR